MVKTKNIEAQIAVYQALLDQAKNYHESDSEITFFDTGFRGHYENPTTELLEFFLNPNNCHQLGDVFYQGLLTAIGADIASSGGVESIQREVATSTGGRIDLLLTTEHSLIVIECKVYHEQDNPFGSYERYAKQEAAGKQIHQVILCINGISSIENWSGISYRGLTEAIRPYLGDRLMGHPLNKWAILAREFLLHLNRFEEKEFSISKIDQFLIDNHHDINELMAAKYQLSTKLNRRVNELEEMMDPSCCNEIWIYNKTCLVFDFIIDDAKENTDKPYRIAFDLILSESGWKLFLFARNVFSENFLNKLKAPLGLSTKDAKTQKYLLTSFDITEELNVIKTETEKWLSRFIHHKTSYLHAESAR